MSDLDLKEIREKVAKIKAEKSELLEDMISSYKVEAYRRERERIPVIAFCGPGRSGKDLACKWLSEACGTLYTGSISYAVSPLIAESLGVSREEAFADRHSDRLYWFEWCNALRSEDPTLLVKLTLIENDVVSGIRGDVELHACKEAGVIDLAVWVDNPRVDHDPTLEYSADDCDLVIRNAGGKLEYFNRLKKLSNYLGFKENYNVKN